MDIQQNTRQKPKSQKTSTSKHFQHSGADESEASEAWENLSVDLKDSLPQEQQSGPLSAR